jgi:hypothetical protein
MAQTEEIGPAMHHSLKIRVSLVRSRPWAPFFECSNQQLGFRMLLGPIARFWWWVTFWVTPAIGGQLMLKLYARARRKFSYKTD